MQTIQSLIDLIELKGVSFNINFKERNLSVDGANYISCGIISDELIIDEYHAMKEEDVIPYLEDCFISYYYSIPSEKSQSRCKNYFVALKENELSDSDMMYGTPREVARFHLEASLLILVLLGKFEWSSSFGNWFWQSKIYKEFIILRDWVEQK